MKTMTSQYKIFKTNAENVSSFLCGSREELKQIRYNCTENFQKKKKWQKLIAPYAGYNQSEQIFSSIHIAHIYYNNPITFYSEQIIIFTGCC